MGNVWKTVVGVIVAIGIIGGASGGYRWLDTNYARASDVKLNSIEIKINTVKDDIRWYKDQMNSILRENGVREPYKLPDYAYHNWKQYEDRVKELEVVLNDLMARRR